MGKFFLTGLPLYIVAVLWPVIELILRIRGII